MSQIETLSDALVDVADLVKSGDSRKAKHQMAKILDVADASSLGILRWCAATLEHYPFPIAVDKMRNAWKRAPAPQYRDLIAACVPEQDNGQYIPTNEAPAEPPYGRNSERAPRNSHRRVDRSRRKARHTPHQARQNAHAARYFRERAGVAEGPQLKDRDDRAQDAQVYASGLDYDKAAVPDVRRLPCVSCWLERASADATTNRVRAGHGDDGLCGECRESKRPGIPELPRHHTLTDAVAARCAFIVARTGPSARAILRNEWRRASSDTRRQTLIAEWVKTHPLPETTTTPQPSPTPTAVDGACECGSIRQVRHGLCLDCRKLDSATAA
ncbi:hypothetical protein [Pseudonocardia kunmingensis]|uniref:Uncharacterized protein n=1 Tax=Pseudonocardia kunmingensis TaxID=630975 RepID=A0A543CX54_9PSEU|nr:hypothetical protein [Pseudonocardia kunmingensis]TQM01687.1 hypothetical protein FB558_8588 [Pseudonocardia kunmingensis]